MKTIDTTKNFDKQFAKLSEKLRNQFKQKVELFERDRTTAQLRDHALKGRYLGYRSINITGDIRALYYEQGESIIIFAFIGSHSQLYGK